MIQEEKIKKCLKELIDTEPDLYEYVTPKGLRELRVNIASYLNEKLNTKIDENNMIITSGSQQSIYLLSRVLLGRNDTIISEEPTYYGTVKIFNELKTNVLTVRVDEKGINLDELKEKVAINNPKFIYVVPTFHNPTGISWSNEQRKKFLETVNQHNITIIEDDPYSELNYYDEKFLSLYELNKGKNVIYLGTFSKIICPSLTVGYILADEETTNRLYEYKFLNDLNTSLFVQRFINLYLEKYNIKDDIKIKKEKLKNNLEHIEERLSNEFPDISLSDARGGLFMVAHLPNKEVPTTMYDNNYFSKDTQNYIRINISNTNINEIVNEIKEAQKS